MRRVLLCLALLGAAAVPGPTWAAAAGPNIVFILADDLGYGDVGCFNPEGKIRTPRLDGLAAEGMRFTDAHSSSAVCTPTRYGILTGRYNWRSRLKNGVLGGYSRRLIEPGRLTVPEFLRGRGYHTACIGKWHLGMDWPLTGGGYAGGDPDGWKVDYTGRIANGPLTVGFDSFFGISASLDMPPYVYIENDRVTETPTVEKEWIRKGPAAAGFEAVDVLPALTRRAVDYVSARAQTAQAGHPFFLYFPLNSPHTPILPAPGWRGKSRLNPYADFVMQTDAAVGEVLDALARHGLTTNTLVIVTSDNGCSPQANFAELASKGHHPSAQFRGHKADIFEGGHRIPFIVRWPGRVQPGAVSDQLICLTDLFATCADILGVSLPANAAEDSVSLLPVLEGRASRPLREAVVHHSINGSFAIRQGDWKLALCADSGGWSEPKPRSKAAEGLPGLQLYNLQADTAERNNRQADEAAVAERLTRLLESYVQLGRSTPGAPQTNTTPVHWRPKD